MVEGNLTKEKIESGAFLIRQLDREDFRASAAFWFYYSEVGSWKLVISGDRVTSRGSKYVYRTIQKILKKHRTRLRDLSLDDFSVVRSDSELVKLLRNAIRTGYEIGGVRFTNNVVNGRLIEDAYIYRLI